MLALLSLLAMGPGVCAEVVPVYAEIFSVGEFRAAVAELTPSVGGVMYLNPDTYVVKEPIVINGSSHVSIFGAGTDKTLVRKEGEGDVFVFTRTCNSCSELNLRIVGNPGAKIGSGKKRQNPQQLEPRYALANMKHQIKSNMNASFAST